MFKLDKKTVQALANEVAKILRENKKNNNAKKERGVILEILNKYKIKVNRRIISTICSQLPEKRSVTAKKHRQRKKNAIADSMLADAEIIESQHGKSYYDDY